MEFDVDSDPDTMYELFGEDYICFAEYVLCCKVAFRLDSLWCIRS